MFDSEGYVLQTYTIQAAANNAQGDSELYRIDCFGQNAESLGSKLYMDQTYEDIPTSNGTEQTNFNSPTRGTVFGLAAEKIVSRQNQEVDLLHFFARNRPLVLFFTPTSLYRLRYSPINGLVPK